MSIHPQYADRILAGEKMVEFRRTRLPATVSQVVIYATSPRQRLLGGFEVAGIDEGTPAELWDRYQAVGGVTPAAYDAYFKTAKRAFAIKVRRVFRLSVPAALSDLGGGLRAPQSFCYVDIRVVDRLKRGCSSPEKKASPRRPRRASPGSRSVVGLQPRSLPLLPGLPDS